MVVNLAVEGVGCPDVRLWPEDVGYGSPHLLAVEKVMI